MEAKAEIIVADKQVADIKSKAEAMQHMVNETNVTNEYELKAVADKIKAVKTLGKMVKENKEKYTKPAQDIINNARSIYLPIEKICTEAERQLKYKANVYMTAVENERKAKEEKVVVKLEKGSIKEDTAIRQMENVGEEKKSISTDNSQLSRRIRQDIEIVDESLIPKEYWMVDLKKVKKVALAGIKIPGVKVIEVSSISSR